MNENTKQTPGPWINNGGRIERANTHGAHDVVARVGTVNHQTHRDTANARLIIAASYYQTLVGDILNDETITAEHIRAMLRPVYNKAIHG